MALGPKDLEPLNNYELRKLQDIEVYIDEQLLKHRGERGIITIPSPDIPLYIRPTLVELYTGPGKWYKMEWSYGNRNDEYIVFHKTNVEDYYNK